MQDEPTSGLDARAAAIVMRTVRNTVNTGRTVVCTIHQPSIDIFEVSILLNYAKLPVLLHILLDGQSYNESALTASHCSSFESVSGTEC